ncbi:MAG: DUF262 domain-containing HNH endonuclease family protein [Pseudomonadota bacterium]
MMKSFSCHATTVGELLRACDTYMVPTFQRYYAWDIGNFSDFWTDISSTFLETSGEYLLGSVFFNNNMAPDLIIIDGQQRLTTASILLCALRNHLREHNFKEDADALEEKFLINVKDALQHFTPKLMLNGYDKDFYENYIFKNCSPEDAKLLVKGGRVPTSNKFLSSCYTFMHRKIEELCLEGWDIKKLADAIISSYDNKLVMIRIDVKNHQDAFLLFETLNERGRELSKFDLLKNHLFSISEERLRIVRSNWDIISQNLGFQRTVKFIRHHWMSTHGDVREKELFNKIQSAITTPLDAETYTSELLEPSGIYGAFFDHDHHVWHKFAKGNKHKLHSLLERIKILQAEQLFIVMLAVLDVAPEACTKMLELLSVLTLRYNTICGLPAANLTPVYIGAAHYIRQTQTCDPQEIFDKFFTHLYPDDQTFCPAFAKKATKDKALARYLLTEINNKLDGRISMKTQTNTTVTDLEHILPHKYEAHWECSQNDFPAGPEAYVNMIGNMTLLSSKLNQDIGNADFSTKKKAYIEDTIAITEDVIKEPVWRAEEILKRQENMANQAVKIWHIHF